MFAHIAHHPQELKALITGAKNLFPGKPCTVIFQPHLYSRTRDLAAEFAASLDLADELILLPIYPARELPIPGVTSATIGDLMTRKPKALEKEALEAFIKNEWLPRQAKAPGLLITAGAGDIDTLVTPIKTWLEQA